MPIRILHIVSYMQRRGLETMLMNCFRHIDREKVMFDFLVHRDFRSDYDDEIEALGGKIYRMPRLNPINPAYFKALREFFKVHPEYRIVHCHLDCMSSIPLGVAKEYGVPVRIAHAHSSSQDKDWKYPLKRYYMSNISKVATHFFACSEKAAEWMYPGQAATIVQNGIEADKFKFDACIRTTIRDELGLGADFAIGNVGRFVLVKNHDFMIRIFSELHKKLPCSKLVLVGNGPLENEIREKARKLNLENDVLFLGVRNDVHRIMQAFDVFLLPSLFEGLGMVAIEAQSSGLPCIVSTTVPYECDISKCVRFLDLKCTPKEWADEILRLKDKPRTSGYDAVVRAGYDIQTTADFLQKFYTDIW